MIRVAADALKGADVFIGVSKANLLSKDMVRQMNKDAIVFAMANPVPEIMPDPWGARATCQCCSCPSSVARLFDHPRERTGKARNSTANGRAQTTDPGRTQTHSRSPWGRK